MVLEIDFKDIFADSLRIIDGFNIDIAREGTIDARPIVIGEVKKIEIYSVGCGKQVDMDAAVSIVHTPRVVPLDKSPNSIICLSKRSAFSPPSFIVRNSDEDGPNRQIPVCVGALDDGRVNAAASASGALCPEVDPEIASD